MNEEQYADVKAGLASNETEHASFRRRLDEHDESLRKLSETQVILERLSNAVSNLSSSIGEIKLSVQGVDRRLGDLEREPADNWKKVTFEIIKYVVIAAIGAGIAYFAKGGIA